MSQPSNIVDICSKYPMPAKQRKRIRVEQLRKISINEIVYSGSWIRQFGDTTVELIHHSDGIRLMVNGCLQPICWRIMNAPFEANWRMEDIFHLISAGIITFLDIKMVSGTSTCVCFLYLPTDSGSGPAWTLARCTRHHVVPGISASHISNVCWIA